MIRHSRLRATRAFAPEQVCEHRMTDGLRACGYFGTDLVARAALQRMRDLTSASLFRVSPVSAKLGGSAFYCCADRHAKVACFFRSKLVLREQGSIGRIFRESTP